MNGAPFNGLRKPYSRWLDEVAIPRNRVTIRNATLNKPLPWDPNRIVDPTCNMGSLEWHYLKHSTLGELKAGMAPNDYLADINAAISGAIGRVCAGVDGGPKVGISVSLPDPQLLTMNLAQPYFLVIVYDVGWGSILTAFPQSLPGYPPWHNKKWIRQ